MNNDLLTLAEGYWIVVRVDFWEKRKVGLELEKWGVGGVSVRKVRTTVLIGVVLEDGNPISGG